jgi:hypothetical protein
MFTVPDRWGRNLTWEVSVEGPHSGTDIWSPSKRSLPLMGYE